MPFEAGPGMERWYSREISWWWDEDEMEKLNLPDWCKDWEEIESKSQFYDQMGLIRDRKKEIAKQSFEKSMQDELAKIIEDYPSSKERCVLFRAQALRLK